MHSQNYLARSMLTFLLGASQRISSFEPHPLSPASPFPSSSALSLLFFTHDITQYRDGSVTDARRRRSISKSDRDRHYRSRRLPRIYDDSICIRMCRSSRNPFPSLVNSLFFPYPRVIFFFSRNRFFHTL